MSNSMDETDLPAAKADNLPVSVALGPRGLAPKNLDELWVVAGAYSNSKMTPQNYSQSDVFVAFNTGLQLGFTLTQSISRIPVVNGVPSIMGEACLALIISRSIEKRGPIEVGCDGEGDGRVGWCKSWRDGWEEERRTEFSWTEAKTAGLASGNVYTKYGKDMLIWKAVSRHVKRNYPDVLMGVDIEATVMEITEREINPRSAGPEFQPVAAAPDPLLGLSAPAEEVDLTPQEDRMGPVVERVDREALAEGITEMVVSGSLSDEDIEALQVPGKIEAVGGEIVDEDPLGIEDPEVKPLSDDEQDELEALEGILSVTDQHPTPEELQLKIQALREQAAAIEKPQKRDPFGYSICGEVDPYPTEAGEHHCMMEKDHKGDCDWAKE